MNNFKRYSRTLISAFVWLCATSSLFGERIVFDLGYVLFAPSKWAIAKHLGLSKCARYFLRERHNFEDLRHVFSQVLEAVPASHPPFLVAGDEKGTPMSGIMCEQQAGIKNSHQVFEEIYATIGNLDQEHFFSSPCERDLVERLTESVFDPIIFSRVMQPIKQGVELVKLLAAEKDENGNPRHELCILSNFSDEAFQLLYEKYPEIFKHFKPENIFISASFKCFAGLKPCPVLYHHVTAKLQCSSTDIVFLDDQKMNCVGAKVACDWTTIQVKNENFKEIKQELKARGLLS